MQILMLQQRVRHRFRRGADINEQGGAVRDQVCINAGCCTGTDLRQKAA
jgi:hypothetical protein